MVSFDARISSLCGGDICLFFGKGGGEQQLDEGPWFCHTQRDVMANWYSVEHRSHTTLYGDGYVWVDSLTHLLESVRFSRLRHGCHSQKAFLRQSNRGWTNSLFTPIEDDRTDVHFNGIDHCCFFPIQFVIVLLFPFVPIRPTPVWDGHCPNRHEWVAIRH